MNFKKIGLCLALVGLLALGGQALAAPCTIDAVPAATLLLPYFEVDWQDDQGITTLFSINNASAAAVIAHVTLWTDLSVPTLDFDVYLTGYDVQTINLRDIFRDGIIPRTADSARDPEGAAIGKGISPRGVLSQDRAFNNCAQTMPLPIPALDSTFRAHIRNLHTGGASAIFGGACGGLDYGDGIARGYITIDMARRCSLEFPGDEDYFANTAGFDNVLWGDVFYVEPGENFAQGMELVHVEAVGECLARDTPGAPTAGPAEGVCTSFFGAFDDDDYTFYGRYRDPAGNDQREPLGSIHAARYLSGGAFDGGTEYLVWRDPKLAQGPFTCPVAAGLRPPWYPLGQEQVIAFDEQQQPEELCFSPGEGQVSPPIDPTVEICFPAEAQRVPVGAENPVPGATGDLIPSADFGWMFLNLNTSVTGADFNPVAQSWVGSIFRAEGRFSVGYHAIQLDSVCDYFDVGFTGENPPTLPFTP